MKRRHFLIGSTVAGTALAYEGCSALSIPPSRGGYALNVGYSTSTVGGYTMRTRTYNGSTVGPMFQTRPGSMLSITVNNQLPPNPAAVVPSGTVRLAKYESMYEVMRRRASGTTTAAGTVDPMNNPHAFNTTNLHVHGIQTVPHLYDPIGTSNASSMMIGIEPGKSFAYSFPIPPDHPSGLFWYHPHHHGSTDVQVSSGMAGLIVVRGAIDDVPEIARMREIFVVVQTLNVNHNPQTGIYEYEPIAYAVPTFNPSTGGYSGTTDYTMFTTNGQGIGWVNNNDANPAPTVLSVPQFTMAPGEVVRVRFLNGTNQYYLPLVLPGMTCYQIGFDGINLPAPVAATFDFSGTVSAANMNAVNTCNTSPGNRVELLVQAPQTPGTYTLSAAAQSDIEFPFPSFPIAHFVVSGSPVSMAIPAALPIPTREYPLIADGEIMARRTVTFNESTTQPPNFDLLLTGFWPWMNNGLFDDMTINTNVSLGTAEEWTVANTTMCGHPFHIHTNSFQLTHINGAALPVPQIYDTFMVPPGTAANPGTITFRIRFKQFPGKTVYHCHILPHEDTGMMQNILIT